MYICGWKLSDVVQIFPLLGTLKFSLISAFNCEFLIFDICQWEEKSTNSEPLCLIRHSMETCRCALKLKEFHQRDLQKHFCNKTPARHRRVHSLSLARRKTPSHHDMRWHLSLLLRSTLLVVYVAFNLTWESSVLSKASSLSSWLMSLMSLSWWRGPHSCENWIPQFSTWVETLVALTHSIICELSPSGGREWKQLVCSLQYQWYAFPADSTAMRCDWMELSLVRCSRSKSWFHRHYMLARRELLEF